MLLAKWKKCISKNLNRHDNICFFFVFFFVFFFTSSFLFYCVGIAISKDYLEIFYRNHMKEIFVRIRLTFTPPGTAIREL
jgi:hypothetical protein